VSDQTVDDLARAYDARAADYAELWAPVLRPHGRALLERIGPGDADTFLDLGTGTGTLLADIAALAPAARILAIDRSEGMLRMARGAPALRAVMDAQSIALAPGSVDAGVMAFVIFTVPDPAGVMAEANRVIRPGGGFGVATWGDEPDVPADAIWGEELEASGAPPDEVARINRRDVTDTTDKLRVLFAGAGFVDIETWTDRLNLLWHVDDYFRFMASGPPRRRLVALSADQRRRCLERIRSRLGELSPADFAERSEIVFATGRRS
jgi:SAM-dependent methyltransferase